MGDAPLSDVCSGYSVAVRPSFQRCGGPHAARSFYGGGPDAKVASPDRSGLENLSRSSHAMLCFSPRAARFSCPNLGCKLSLLTLLDDGFKAGVQFEVVHHVM